MFCSNCGAELEEGARFCRECGASVEEGKSDRGRSDTDREKPDRADGEKPERAEDPGTMEIWGKLGAAQAFSGPEDSGRGDAGAQNGSPAAPETEEAWDEGFGEEFFRKREEREELRKKRDKRVRTLLAAVLAVVCLTAGGALALKNSSGSRSPALPEGEMCRRLASYDDMKGLKGPFDRLQAARTMITESFAAAEEQKKTEEQQKKPADLPNKYFIYKGHTYAFYDAEAYHLDSYQKVVNFCRRQGGHLAVINDREENAYLYDLLSRNYDKTAFFGYSDEDRESVWVWSDGESDYRNWANDRNGQQPDNGANYGSDEDYAEFAYERNTASANDGTWNDARFMANTSKFICEWEYVIED